MLSITAKIQLVVNDSQKSLLVKTMSSYRQGCNFVSKYIYENNVYKQNLIHKAVYETLKNKYNLKSQMACSVTKSVLAKYRALKTNGLSCIKPEFKKPQYDLVWNRDYSLSNDYFSVNTVNGRIKLPYINKGMEKYFDKNIYEFGTAKLVYKHNKFYIHISVSFETPECPDNKIRNIVGVDRGINFVITTYDSNGKTGFVSGKSIKNKRANYQSLRTSLQKRKTASSRRRLKKIGNRENRWMQDVNHCISKALVLNHPENTLFVLEDLTGIRSATESVKKKNRYVSVSWSFYDLEQKIDYKCRKYGSRMIKVPPEYTSQCCPKCGHTEASNRHKDKHIFICKTCGYTSNDDRIGAMNLHRMGIQYLVPDAIVSEHVSNTRGSVNDPDVTPL